MPEKRNIYRGDNGYERYAGLELSPMPIPGGPGPYVANASEHDGMGDTTHLPTRHVEMTQRRFSKLKLLEDGTYESENAEESIALLPWGGSKGSAREAYDQMIADGMKIAWYYTMQIHPMPPKLMEELRKKELVLIPELNYLGQLASILRAEGIKAEALTQYTGKPFKVRDLIARVTERLEAGQKELVNV